jgi:hypothetical protein
MTLRMQNWTDEEVRVLSLLLRRSQPAGAKTEQPLGQSVAAYPSLPMTFNEGLAMMRAWGGRATPWTWEPAPKTVRSER